MKAKSFYLTLVLLLFSHSLLAQPRYKHPRFKRLSIKRSELSNLKTYHCFDTTVKNHGKWATREWYGQEIKDHLIGLVNDSKCKPFEKKYRVEVLNKHLNEEDLKGKLACIEYDQSGRYHRKIVRLISRDNTDVSPCKEELVYRPRRISKKCANHADCLISTCALDIYNQKGERLLTRYKYSKDAVKQSCPAVKKGFLLTKAGYCYEYDLPTNGKKHFYRDNGACAGKEDRLLLTEYKMGRPQESIFRYLLSYAAGEEKCYEIDAQGGEVFKRETKLVNCEKKPVVNGSRNANKDLNGSPDALETEASGVKRH